MALDPSLCSRMTARILFRETFTESLCSRAYRLQWKLWIRVFGVGHCLRSYQFYHPTGAVNPPGDVK